MFCGLGDESQFRTTITMLLPRLYILWHRKEKLRVLSICVDLAGSKIAITSAKIVGFKNSWTHLQHLSSDL